MRILKIEDISIDELKSKKYDLAIFASGYEGRCTNLSQQVNKDYINDVLILGFNPVGTTQSRLTNDKHFIDKWVKEPTLIASGDELAIYKLLNEKFRADGNQSLSILIDYSSMSRTWYAAVLNWIRFSNISENVTIDLGYSIGAYSDVLPPIAVQSILPLPGCEGASGTLTSSIAVFGLGFERLAPLCVLDKLQPDEIFAYLSEPSNRPEYTQIARRENSELIAAAKTTLELPIESIKICFLKLSELITPYLKTSDITFVPMGPKPHVLAAVLLAINFRQVTCLHVHGKQCNEENVKTTGEIILSRVIFKPDQGEISRSFD